MKITRFIGASLEAPTLSSSEKIKSSIAGI